MTAGDYLAVVSAMVAIVGVPLAITTIRQGTKQLLQAEAAEMAHSRAYVSVSLEILKGTPGKPDGVLMVIQNHGRFAARDISVNFAEEDRWQNIVKPTDLPFNSPNSIPQLLPGQTLKYFVGPVDKNSRLVHLKTDQISANLSYMDGITVDRREEIIFLTLMHLRYAMKS